MKKYKTVSKICHKTKYNHIPNERAVNSEGNIKHEKKSI